MKINSINSLLKNNINFRARPEQLNNDNIEEYLRKNRVSLSQASNDLLVINDRAVKERASFLHLKRTAKLSKFNCIFIKPPALCHYYIIVG